MKRFLPIPFTRKRCFDREQFRPVWRSALLVLCALLMTIPVSGKESLAGKKNAFARAYDKAAPSVVSIRGEKKFDVAEVRNDAYKRQLAEKSKQESVTGMGSGIIMDERGYVITNYHVVKGLQNIQVTTFDGEIYRNIEFVGHDPGTDLALLRIVANREFTPITFGKTERVYVCEDVLAIGNPFGYANAAARGIVSGLNRPLASSETVSYERTIQTDTPINPGNSGGPLVNLDGEESFEMIKFAGVRHPEDRDDNIVHAVGMCFADVDGETRRSLQQTKALAEALEAAEEASRAKTVFLSNMSHEIRTPMNAIIGLDSIALSNPNIPQETREELEQIGVSAKHLLGIINDILDMSRIESGRLALTDGEFAIAKTLEQVNTIIGGQCSDKGIDYECHVKGELADYYIGDDMKLRQVMINVLGNAVKFTPAGGKVTFTVEEVARAAGMSTLQLTVADTGIGISEDYLPKIFEAFSQEDSSAANKYGSTGLGLSITKNLVELMGGTISVQSEKGVGTTFTLTVTLANSDRHDEAAAGDDPAAGGHTHLEGRRVLLAEDVEVNAEIMVVLLDRHGMEADIAENGQVAVDKFASHEPGYYSAVLMDMRMPVMNGLEATEAIRGMDRADAARIPIIALTANAFDEDVQRSMQAGLDAHLSKPVEADALFATLEALIEQREQK